MEITENSIIASNLLMYKYLLNDLNQFSSNLFYLRDVELKLLTTCCQGSSTSVCFYIKKIRKK